MGDDSDEYRDEDSAFLALVNDKPETALAQTTYRDEDSAFLSLVNDKTALA